jgi:hypothetical protein
MRWILPLNLLIHSETGIIQIGMICICVLALIQFNLASTGASMGAAAWEFEIQARRTFSTPY